MAIGAHDRRHGAITSASTDTLDSEPTTDVVPVRRGTWIEEEALWDDRYWTCSVCHESWCLTEDGTPEDHDMRYCPHCGAKMEDKNA